MKPLNLLYTYITLILILVILPLNSTGYIIHDTYVVEIRLDYLLHSLLFIPWVFLFKKAANTNIILTIILGWVFGCFAEGLQYFLPYRAFNINDLLANLIGVVIGLIFVVPYVNNVLRKLSGIINNND